MLNVPKNLKTEIISNCFFRSVVRKCLNDEKVFESNSKENSFEVNSYSYESPVIADNSEQVSNNYKNILEFKKLEFIKITPSFFILID